VALPPQTVSVDVQISIHPQDTRESEISRPRRVHAGHGGSQISEYIVRTHKPLPLAWTPANHKQLILATHQVRNETPLGIPKSAVFIASRLHSFRKYHAIAQHLPSDQQEAKDAHHQMWSALLSMCLYMGAVLDSEEQEKLLGFDPDTWLNVFNAGTAAGSIAFGLAGGVYENGKFLVEQKNRMGI